MFDFIFKRYNDGMTATELLTIQLEDASYQIEKVLDGVDEAHLDIKLSPTSMSIRQSIEHLCEVYTAVDEESRGIKHAWGEYSIQYDSFDDLKSKFTSLRVRALGLVANPSNKEGFTLASEFMVAHEYYHVGQLASLRIATDSAWNPYSIYRHG